MSLDIRSPQILVVIVLRASSKLILELILRVKSLGSERSMIPLHITGAPNENIVVHFGRFCDYTHLSLLTRAAPTEMKETDDGSGVSAT